MSDSVRKIACAAMNRGPSSPSESRYSIGVCAVDGGRAVLQHLDASDGVNGDEVDVDELNRAQSRRAATLSERGRRNPAAVEQNQRRVRTQSAQ
jgi:hypothetical protein